MFLYELKVHYKSPDPETLPDYIKVIEETDETASVYAVVYGCDIKTDETGKAIVQEDGFYSFDNQESFHVDGIEFYDRPTDVYFNVWGYLYPGVAYDSFINQFGGPDENSYSVETDIEIDRDKEAEMQKRDSLGLSDDEIQYYKDFLNGIIDNDEYMSLEQEALPYSEVKDSVYMALSDINKDGKMELVVFVDKYGYSISSADESGSYIDNFNESTKEGIRYYDNGFEIYELEGTTFKKVCEYEYDYEDDTKCTVTENGKTRDITSDEARAKSDEFKNRWLDKNSEGVLLLNKENIDKLFE